MHILFHGASVTQQSGESSYIEHLKVIFGGGVTLTNHGYGGCHLNDAGFLTIQDAIAESPDICLLDWNTTSQSEFDMNKVNFMVNELIASKIKPVFIILARDDTLFCDRKSEIQIKNLCKHLSLECWDLRPIINKDLHLRDSVHTNVAGAKVYSDFLYGQLIAFINKGFLNPLSDSIDLKYSPKIISYKMDMSVHECHSLFLDIDITGANPEIFAELMIGPSTPSIRINNDQFITTWDPWCHYERRSFISFYKLKDSQGKQPFEIKVLSDAIDYSQCARPNFQFNGAKELKLKRLICCDFTILGSQVKNSI